jgi:hypothetical protein
MQRHEKEERDGKQAATNNMYSQCNELFGELVECFEND